MFMFMAMVSMSVLVSMLLMSVGCHAHADTSFPILAHHHNQSVGSHSILSRHVPAHALLLLMVVLLLDAAAVRQVEGSVAQKVLTIFDFTESR